MTKTTKDDLVIDLLHEVRQSQKEHSTILIKMEKDVQGNKDGLDEHMKQTRAVKSLVIAHKETNDRRFDNLEEPGVVISAVKKYIMWIGGLCGSIFGIIKFIDYIK